MADRPNPVAVIGEVIAAIAVAGLAGGVTALLWGVGPTALGTAALALGVVGLLLVVLRRWAAGLVLVVLGVCAGLALFFAAAPKSAAPPPAARSAYLLPSVRPWPGGVVPVCWLNRPDRVAAPLDDLRMILAVKAAEETWSAAGAVSFKDVGTCPANFKGARLLIGRAIDDAEAPELGAAIADQDQPVIVPFIFPSRSGCSAGGRFGGADVCAYGEAVHELGHLLGLPDLHYSKQAPEACKATLRQDHPWLDVPYDPASVMNACNPDHLFGKPSAGDLAAVKAIYGG